MLIGNKVHHLPSCHSTNEYLREMIFKGEISNGDVVMTQNQKRGKGQRGNSWESEDNTNLTFSFYFEPKGLNASEQFSLNYFVTLSLHSFLRQVLIDPDELKIKWPNDIYVGSMKISGVLIENQVVSSFVASSIIGIGLNVNQKNFKTENATSISLLNNDTYDLKEALGMLLHHLNRKVSLISNLDALRKEYFLKLLGFNRVRKYIRLRDNRPFNGKIIDVQTTGELILLNERLEKEVFDLKEIKFLF